MPISNLQINKQILFRTSSATSFLVQGGVINVAGLSPVAKRNLIEIVQVKYRAAVAQVVTIGSNSYTPVGGTQYEISVFDPNRTVSGYNEPIKYYGYITPDDITTLGATAALQREAIHVAIIAKVNADTTCHATAATLAGGTGFTITDNLDYYPVHAQTMTNMLFVNTVLKTSGFTAVPTITTAGVSSVGVGAKLASEVAVTDYMNGGNLTSGYAIYPKTLAGLPAVSGQKYDAFIINSLAPAGIPESISGQQLAFVNSSQTIWVDNGTGTDTANLAGFVAMEEEILRAGFGVFNDDPSATYDFFDQALIASATYPTTGAAISTTDNVVMAVSTANGVNANTFYVNPIAAHTLLTPIVTTGGISTYLDVVTQEGIEFSVPNITQCPKQFVVGQTAMSVWGRITFGGIAATDWKTLSFGLRKKAAYAVDQTAYEAASVATAALGVPIDTGVAPVINVITGPGAAGALTNTSTTVAPTAGQTLDFYITVDIAGVTKFYVNGIDRTPAAGYTFTAGLILMPFLSFRHGAGTAAEPRLVSFAALPSKDWRIN